MNKIVAAGLLGISQKQDHITSIDLSSFVATFRIDFTVMSLSFQALQESGPRYIYK